MPAVLVVLGVVGLFLLSTLLNKNTQAPMDLKNVDAIKCGACSNYSCGIKQQMEEEEE